ncbi:MAG TPA: prefoldin subunit beta [Candidatus Nanoarchaeia archaeon]|nr:prefoldin subunit beta [Candidatus Nanoarchaeia archaeon]
MAIKKEAEAKISQLQLVEQSVQALSIQKQQLQAQLQEVESALEELAKTEKAYRIIGNIMVASSKDEIIKDLESRKETAELRIKSIERQENQLKEKAESMRTEIMEELKK